jgi:hypothetical protein
MTLEQARAEVLEKARAYRTLCEARLRRPGSPPLESPPLDFIQNEMRKREARFELAGAALRWLECEEAQANHDGR